jgi:hypothetical protein
VQQAMHKTYLEPIAGKAMNLKTELEPRISRINTDYQCLMKTEFFTPQGDACLHSNIAVTSCIRAFRVIRGSFPFSHLG